MDDEKLGFLYKWPIKRTVIDSVLAGVEDASRRRWCPHLPAWAPDSGAGHWRRSAPPPVNWIAPRRTRPPLHTASWPPLPTTPNNAPLSEDGHCSLSLPARTRVSVRATRGEGISSRKEPTVAEPPSDSDLVSMRRARRRRVRDHDHRIASSQSLGHTRGDNTYNLLVGG